MRLSSHKNDAILIIIRQGNTLDMDPRSSEHAWVRDQLQQLDTEWNSILKVHGSLSRAKFDLVRIKVILLNSVALANYSCMRIIGHIICHYRFGMNKSEIVAIKFYLSNRGKDKNWIKVNSVRRFPAKGVSGMF